MLFLPLVLLGAATRPVATAIQSLRAVTLRSLTRLPHVLHTVTLVRSYRDLSLVFGTLYYKTSSRPFTSTLSLVIQIQDHATS